MTPSSGKTMIVTGGGKGIGREIARLFGREGFNVVISGRDRQALERSAEELSNEGSHILPVPGDVTSDADCRNLIERAVDRFRQIDILVNNAGMTMRGTFEKTELSVFRKIMDVNFGGAVTMTKFALPNLIASGGSVLFISSIAGLKGLPGGAPYSASKMALTSFSESLRSELMGRVHVGVLYVSFTENDPEKSMLNANGEIVPLRRDSFSSSQKDVARAALKMVRRRRRQIVMTPLGKTANVLYKLFPGISEQILARFAPRSKMYALDDIFEQ